VPYSQRELKPEMLMYLNYRCFSALWSTPIKLLPGLLRRGSTGVAFRQACSDPTDRAVTEVWLLPELLARFRIVGSEFHP
jgi:hypothetical protein